MKKILLRIFVLALGIFAFVGTVSAENLSQLDLYQKDSDWKTVRGGAFGVLNYSEEEFNFNGHRLEKNTKYTLIRYKDTSPVAVCLGTALSTNGGQVHITGEMLKGGPKAWLVLNADINCDLGEFTDWNPSMYLFENEFLNITPEEPEEPETPEEPTVPPYDILHEDHPMYDNMEHIDLYQKDPEWVVIPEAGAGAFHWNENNFAFDAWRLSTSTDYTLVRVTTYWPAVVVCLGNGISDNENKLHLEGEMLSGGAKIWLILTSDVDCDNNTLINWNQPNYLFENELIAPEDIKPETPEEPETPDNSLCKKGKGIWRGVGHTGEKNHCDSHVY